MYTLKRMLMILALAIGVLGMGIFPVYGATFSVTNCNDDGLGSLRQAVMDANTTIGVDDITFAVVCNPITLTTGEIEIFGESLTINGNGSVISGNDASRIFLVTGLITVTIDTLTLRDGLGFFGGAIRSDSGILVISNSTFADNNSEFGTSGGAIYNGTSLTITNSTFTGNSAPAGGGAIEHGAGNLTVSNSTFTSNSAGTGASGGAIGGLGTMTINDSTFTSNSATRGGALGNSGIMTVNNSTFTGNTATTEGGAISNFASLTLNGNDIRNNIAPTGSAVNISLGSAGSQNTHYQNNDCVGAIADNGGNTVVTAAGCPGVAPTALSVSPLTCSGDSAVFEILAGDGDFSITGDGNGLPINPAAAGLYGLVGPDTWMNMFVTELTGDRETFPLGGIICPDAVIIPPTTPISTAPSATVLGCALDTADGVEIANAPDNTYCRELMKNGAVIGYSGAVPADLINLGVILAVDVYRLEGGQSITSFPNYARVCLAGSGRLFYLDARTSPRVQVELTTETDGNFTCGWIPAAGTLVLTN